VAVLALCLAGRPAAAQVREFTFNFLSCDFESGCPHPTQIAAFTYVGTALEAPPLPPSGAYESPPDEIPVATVLAGTWDAVYLKSYRNIFGTTGSYFVFTGLQAANGIAYVDNPIHAVGIDGYVAGPTTNPLTWEDGTYTGLIAFQCNYGVGCVSTPGAEDTVKLIVSSDEYVPEPGTLGLLAIAMASMVVARRRKALR